MFGLSVVEVALLLLWAVGIACAVAGAMSGVFTVRDTIVGIAIALFIPVIGSIGAIALYVSRRSSIRTRATT